MPKVLLFGIVADSNSRGLFGFHFARDRAGRLRLR
jgi:hypothetical protein